MGTAIVRVTRGVRRVTSADLVGGALAAAKDEIVEVLGYRSMRLTLRLWSLAGSPSPPVVSIAIDTGMNADDPGSFVSLGVFDPLDAAPATVQRVFTDLQRYARWRIIAFGMDDAQFSLEGVVYE